jgi:hypothetical protein
MIDGSRNPHAHSLRTTLAPMPSTPMSLLPTGAAAGGVKHRLDDSVITVQRQILPWSSCRTVASSSLPPVAMHDIDRRLDHARGAIAALQAVIVAERRLHRVQLAALGDAFDGGDAGTCGLCRQHGAGFHCVAVHMDDAGSALAAIAADMRAGQTQIFAQQIHQQGASTSTETALPFIISLTVDTTRSHVGTSSRTVRRAGDLAFEVDEWTARD